MFDTNTVVSALLFGSGRLAPLRAAWQTGVLLPLLSAATVQELVRVLAYPKYQLLPEEQAELLADYLPYGEVIRPWKPMTGLPACRDPKESMFLELATAGGAQWLVTGDKDLLALSASVSRFGIVDPAVALGYSATM